MEFRFDLKTQVNTVAAGFDTPPDVKDAFPKIFDGLDQSVCFPRDARDSERATPPGQEEFRK